MLGKTFKGMTDQMLQWQTQKLLELEMTRDDYTVYVRPELVVDALKEGPKAIVASAVTVTVMDLLLRGADVLAEVAWQAGRGDAQQVLDGLAATLSQAGSRSEP